MMIPWQINEANFIICNISLLLLFQICNKQFSVFTYHSLYSKINTKFLRGHYFHSRKARLNFQSDIFYSEVVTIFRMIIFVHNFKDKDKPLTLEKQCYLEGSKWDSLWFHVMSIYYEGRSESKERIATQRYLLIIGKKQNMQVLSHTFTYFST